MVVVFMTRESEQLENVRDDVTWLNGTGFSRRQEMQSFILKNGFNVEIGAIFC